MLTSPGVKSSPCSSTVLALFTPLRKNRRDSEPHGQDRVAAKEGKTRLEGEVMRERG